MRGEVRRMMRVQLSAMIWHGKYVWLRNAPSRTNNRFGGILIYERLFKKFLTVASLENTALERYSKGKVFGVKVGKRPVYGEFMSSSMMILILTLFRGFAQLSVFERKVTQRISQRLGETTSPVSFIWVWGVLESMHSNAILA
jgi:hypothetical protein